MSNSTTNLQRKINSAEDLQSVVRTMKALASSRISQYENAVIALTHYYRTVELGLHAYFQKKTERGLPVIPPKEGTTIVTNAIIFGSDQGLVGQFNEVIAAHAIKTLSMIPGKLQVWAVGERVHAHLLEAGLAPIEHFSVPNSVKAITPLVGEIVLEIEAYHSYNSNPSLFLFHNRPGSNSRYEPVSQQLLPFDGEWQRDLTNITWPTKNLPELFCSDLVTLRTLIHEYLFISLFQACGESLSSENTSRLIAMERADKNIGELLETLHAFFNRLRQRDIDAELFDVISGFEALSRELKP